MAKVWKILALLLVITALVWLTTMWRWQSAQVDPSTTDLALTLGVLPLVLTAGLVMTLWAVKRLRSYAAAPTAAAPAATTSAAQPAAAAQTAANERSAHVKVLASAVQLRAGSQWSAVQTSIASGECKPDLDAQLKDDDGIAVFTAPMPDLSTEGLADALAEAVETLARAKPEAWAGYEAPAEVLRALTLLEAAAGSMHEALESQWPALAAPPPSQRHKPTAPAMPPMVAIRVAVPARWSAQSQQAAGAWLAQLFYTHIEAGLQAAGQSRAMAHSVRPAVQLHVHPVASAEAFWLLMDQQLLQWQRDKEPGLLWALAADSLVSENDSTAMAASKELFSGNNQRGRVPGEAAAGLLLASPTWPDMPEAEPAQARLFRANLMRRDKSADASGRVSPQTLLQTATDALKASGWAPAQVEHMTSDADHRASRTSEVYETLQELLPHLDTSEQALRLGVGCGDLGVARLLTCVALTAGQVQESQKPALVLGAFPAFERFAVVMTPPVAPPEAPAAASAPAA
jgi:hypothetical protein